MMMMMMIVIVVKSRCSFNFYFRFSPFGGFQYSEYSDCLSVCALTSLVRDAGPPKVVEKVRQRSNLKAVSRIK